LHTKTSLIVFLILLFSALALAQDVPDIKRRQEDDRRKKRQERTKQTPADTTGRGPARAGEEFAKAEKDTTKLIPVESGLYWYDIENHLSQKTDTSRFSIFQLTDEKGLVYKDMTDILNDQPLWLDFDLAEAGRMAYISTTNLYPHQLSFYYNNILMNDFMQGMFNAQFMPLNYIQTAETDLNQGNIRNYAIGNSSQINVTSNSEQFQEPWTKILYKQGSYGYSDLDVSLAVPFSPTFAMQLGGTNRYFDGTIPDAGFRGVNYRGEFTWQYSPEIYIRTQLFLNRNKAGLTAFDFSQKILSANNEENRDDIFADVTWLQDDSTGQRLHVLLYHSFYGRKLRDNYSDYTIESKSVRYGIDANYNIFLAGSEILLGAGVLYPKVFGDPFPETFIFPSYNVYGRWRLPLSGSLMLKADAQALKVKDYKPLLMPSAGLDYNFTDKQFASFEVSAGQRLPNATERFWDFDTLYGKEDLDPEKYFSASLRYHYKYPKLWHLDLKAGYHRIDDEIVWLSPQFKNAGSRDFYFFSAGGSFTLWKFTLGLGGQYTLADINLTPAESAWGRLHFHDSYLNGALIVDAYGSAFYQGRHQNIMYQPRLDRFYPGVGNTDAFVSVEWKIVATIQTAQIFIEMENALSTDYQIVFGYLNYLRLLRFGINWVLWD